MPFAGKDGVVKGDVECQNDTQVVDIEHRFAVDVRRPMAEARDADVTTILAAC